MGRFSGAILTFWAGSSRTVPSSTIRPPASGSRPIRARSVVDFPEPFGPSRASTSPEATVKAVSRLSRDSRNWISASSMADSVAAGNPAPEDHDHEADHDQNQAERDRLIHLARALADIDRQRHGLGLPRQVASEGDRGPELAQR